MLEFLWPWVALVWPLPLLIRWLWPATPVPPQALQVPFLERLQQLSGSSQTPRFQTQQLAFLLALVCWTLLVGAATRPQWVGERSWGHAEISQLGGTDDAGPVVWFV